MLHRNFHARYGGQEGLIVIATGEVYAGTLPGRALRLVREWLQAHRSVEPREGRWLRLWSSDGAVKDVDVSGPLSRGGVFARIRDDRSVFEQVRVNPESRTIEWPGDIDLDPDVLYGRAEPTSGARIERRTITAAA
jgi:Protein of unknown function (DUF2442)/Domain of unknown function (DUF4160)